MAYAYRYSYVGKDRLQCSVPCGLYSNFLGVDRSHPAIGPNGLPVAFQKGPNSLQWELQGLRDLLNREPISSL